MKSLITNYGRGLAVQSFIDVITDYILIGASTADDTTLNNLLDNMETTTADYDINNNSSPLYNFLIGTKSPIVSSQIDNERKLVVTINISKNSIPAAKFVYAVALLDKDSKVFSINRFQETFNTINESSIEVILKHHILSDKNSGKYLNVFADIEAYITRREFLDWADGHNHDNNYVDIRTLNALLNEIDQIKEDKSTIGNIKEINSVNNSNIVNVLNEIISNIGNLQDLDSGLRSNLVVNINKLLNNVGRLDELVVTGSTSLVDAINRVHNIVINRPISFKDNISVSDVNWGDKANVSYIGDIDTFHGKARTNIVDALNEVYDNGGDKERIESVRNITINKNYRLFSSDQTYSGELSIRLYKNSIKVLSCDIDVNKISGSIKIKNVFFAEKLLNLKLIQQPDWINLQNYLFGCAIVFNNGNLDFSIKTNLDLNNEIIFDRFDIEYGKLKLDLRMAELDFSYVGSIAIRENSGNYNEDPLNVYTIKDLNIENEYISLFNLDKKFEARIDTDLYDNTISSFNISSNGNGDYYIGDLNIQELKESDCIFEKIYKPLNKQELEEILYDTNIFFEEIDTSLITDMSYLFKDSTRTNEEFNNISAWNIDKVTNMDSMFENAVNFNQNISNWDMNIAIPSVNNIFKNTPNLLEDNRFNFIAQQSKILKSENLLINVNETTIRTGNPFYGNNKYLESVIANVSNSKVKYPLYYDNLNTQQQSFGITTGFNDNNRGYSPTEGFWYIGKNPRINYVNITNLNLTQTTGLTFEIEFEILNNPTVEWTCPFGISTLNDLGTNPSNSTHKQRNNIRVEWSGTQFEFFDHRGSNLLGSASMGNAPLNTKINMIFTLEGQTLKGYRDFVLQGTGSVETYTDAFKWIFLNRGSNSSSFANMKVHKLRLWNTVLNDTEINKLLTPLPPTSS